MLTPLTILSVRQGPAYDERAAASLGVRLDRLAAWNSVLLMRLVRATRRPWLQDGLRRLDADWRDVMMSYRMAAER